MRELDDKPSELPPGWQELSGALRAFFARRVPARDVDDLVQDTFVEVSQGLATLRDHERLAAWVFRIARNLAVDLLRRRQREVQTEDAAEAVDPGEQRPDLHRAVADCLGAFVDRLPARYAEVLRLSELEELSHREIATRLDLSVSGVKTRVQRGRAQLRDKLLACCTFEFDRRGRVVDRTRRAPGRCDC